MLVYAYYQSLQIWLKDHFCDIGNEVLLCCCLNEIRITAERICTTGSYELSKIYMPNKSFPSNTAATIIINIFVPKFYSTSTNHSVELIDSLRYILYIG